MYIYIYFLHNKRYHRYFNAAGKYAQFAITINDFHFHMQNTVVII